MRVRLSILTSFALLFSIFGLIPAKASIANCFELRGTTSSMSSTSLTMSAGVYAKCTSAQLGSAWSSRFVFSVQEEDGLGLSYECSGPLAGSTIPLLSPQQIGTLICNLRIGSRVFASPRVGATS